MSDAYLEKMFKDTRFVVAATYNEVLLLWENFSQESLYRTPRNVLVWEQLNPGRLVTVGYFHDFPVVISLFWNRLDGVLVMFWEATSRIVDHEMIEKWLRENCAPRWDRGTRLAHTNAANFHQVLNYLRTEKGN